MVRTCHEERPGVCKKSDGNGVTGKRKRARRKRRFLAVVKVEVGAREKTLETGPCGGTSYALATPDQREKPIEEDQ